MENTINEIDSEKLKCILDRVPNEKKENVIKYISILDSIEKKALMIAVEHLKSSFDIIKSNGFVEWEKTGVPDA